MRHGVPFEVAFKLDYITRAAWSIIFSEMEGQKFDWSTMRFKEPTP